MSNIKEKLSSLLEMDYEDLPYLQENASDEEKDANGTSSNILANMLRNIGILEYFVSHDVSAFQQNLSNSARIRLELLQRFDNGDAVSKSYVSMLAYKAVFTALAAGNIKLAHSLVSRLGNRESIEKEYDTKSDRFFGYILKAVIEYSGNAQEKIQYFKEQIENKESEYLGYVEALNAILLKNVDMLDSSFEKILKSHKQMSKGRGRYKDTVDELICIWGLGLVNLAIYYDLNVDGIADALIPKDLFKSKSGLEHRFH